jgi:hypothetical protein
VLQSLEIQGFRGIKDLTLDLQSPVTAISGLNGTGKGTIAQLAGCGYRKSGSTMRRRYYVADFFPVSAVDPEPFSPWGKVVYSYCADKGSDPRQVTVSQRSKSGLAIKGSHSELAIILVSLSLFRRLNAEISLSMEPTCSRLGHLGHYRPKLPVTLAFTAPPCRLRAGGQW